ncbi:MAG: hypothetical protein Q4B58_06150 [Bacteroidales bacterium]|nr:hypothetical protein [Bacteroidales bacterium]
MEERKLSEKESLELISQMIQQTKKDSAIGSGELFLMWGYLCFFCSLATWAMVVFGGAGHDWLYWLMGALGLVAFAIVGRRCKKYQNMPATYASKSIAIIWTCFFVLFASYGFFCFWNWEHAECWAGMLLLGLLLPGIGTFCTGVVLKEKALMLCGGFGIGFGGSFLNYLCIHGGTSIAAHWPAMLVICAVVTLIIPGHILNRKSKK